MIMVSAVGEDDGEIRLILQGPGIPGKKSISLSGLYPGNLEYVKALNREFPLGVDLMISDNLVRSTVAQPGTCQSAYAPALSH